MHLLVRKSVIERNAHIKRMLQDRFQHIFVDEFQVCERSLKLFLCFLLAWISLLFWHMEIQFTRILNFSQNFLKCCWEFIEWRNRSHLVGHDGSITVSFFGTVSDSKSHESNIEIKPLNKKFHVQRKLEISKTFSFFLLVRLLEMMIKGRGEILFYRF